MERSNRHWLYLVSAMVDMALIVGSFIGASYFYLGTLNGFEVSQHYRWNGLSTELMTVYAFLAVCCYAAAHVYGDTYYGRRWRIARKVVVINGVALLAFGSVLYLVRFVDMSRMTLAIFYAASTALIILKDWLISAVLTHIRASGKYQTRVLIAGSGPSARKYARAVGKDRTRLEHVVGYVGAPCEDEDAYLGTHEGGVKDLARALDTQDIDQLVIALEPEEYTYTRQVMAVADKYGVAVQMVPFYSDLLPRNPAIETFHSVSVIDMRSTALDNVPTAALKRIFDILASAFILVLISPLLLITAIGVKLSSPGPILFKQERIGKNRKPFYMLKFRSMRVNAESTTAWSTNEDPRKTKFGSFIRKYSIDELPQFVNVLRGDMSIIGPRPEIPHYVHEFQEEVPLYMLRHQVRPGITGWAQVNGLRGDTSIEERVKYDLYYIEHWSPWFDVKIFFRTIFGGFMNNEKLVK